MGAGRVGGGHSVKKIVEPVRPEPFQNWLKSRLDFHQRQADADAAFGNNVSRAGVQRLCEEIGWEWTDTSARRLYRWRHGMSDTTIGGRNGKRMASPRKQPFERAEVEEALHAAGVDFHDLYPEFAHERSGAPEPEAWCPNCQDHVLVVGDKRGEPVCIWCDWKMSDGHLNGLGLAA